MVFMLSGITTANTPSKNAHAAPNPAITAPSAWECDNHTKQCRENTDVNNNAHTVRRRPLSTSTTKPTLAQSTWSSAPGSQSANGTVDASAVNGPKCSAT